MPQTNKDDTARRFKSSRYDAGYDCELPPEMWTELVGQRRPPSPPPIIDRPIPIKTTRERGPLYFVLFIVLWIYC